MMIKKKINTLLKKVAQLILKKMKIIHMKILMNGKKDG
jgi:hypothetical protein